MFLNSNQKFHWRKKLHWDIKHKSLNRPEKGLNYFCLKISIYHNFLKYSKLCKIMFVPNSINSSQFLRARHELYYKTKPFNLLEIWENEKQEKIKRKKIMFIYVWKRKISSMKVQLKSKLNMKRKMHCCSILEVYLRMLRRPYVIFMVEID